LQYNNSLFFDNTKRVNVMKMISEISKRISPALFRMRGIDIFGYRQWLEDAEKWTPKERNAWRLKQLGDLLEHCWEHVPFYRELWNDKGVKVRRPRSLDELEAYPVVNRDMFREHRDRIIADNLKMIPHKDDATGGTTGSPLKYKQDLSAHAVRYGFGQLWWSLIGYNYGDDVCTISGGGLCCRGYRR
jgi:phenylacetate-CoA ligase